MNKCPDILAIQAYLDEEEVHEDVRLHLQNCPDCQKNHREMAGIIVTADSLKSEASLPAGFYERLAVKTSPRPFPAALAAAVMFLLALLSSYLLYPGYLNWWLSIGITEQVGLMIDFVLALLFAVQTLGYFWLIVLTLILVALEVLILLKFKIVEG